MAVDFLDWLRETIGKPCACGHSADRHTETWKPNFIKRNADDDFPVSFVQRAEYPCEDCPCAGFTTEAKPSDV